MLAGERFVAEFGLGEAPAVRLAETMERALGVLVLMVDATTASRARGLPLA